MIESYLDSVNKEIEDMQALIEKTRHKSIASYTKLLKSGRRTNTEHQVKRYEEVLKACVCVESNGSGCIVDVDGEPMVLTNYHVAGEKGTIKFIMWNDGEYGVAKTIKLDKDKDTAFMEIIQSEKSEMPRVYLEPYKKQSKLIQIHNPYHWYNDKRGVRKGNQYHFPFTVEERDIEKRKQGNLFSHFATIDSSVFYGSSGSPFFSIDNKGILGGVVGIHREWDEEKDDFIGVMINDTTIPKFKF